MERETSLNMEQQLGPHKGSTATDEVDNDFINHNKPVVPVHFRGEEGKRD